MGGKKWVINCGDEKRMEGKLRRGRKDSGDSGTEDEVVGVLCVELLRITGN